MFKASRYNHIWEMEGSNRAVIFNSLNVASMEIKTDYVDLLKEQIHIDLDQLNDEKKSVAAELIKNGFLIETFIDELALLKFRNTSGRFSKNSLALTIIPTYLCNLSCFYCYQDRTMKQVMSIEVQDSLIEFAKKHIIGVKNLNVCWFGGEPLIVWDTINRLTAQLMILAKENNCDYSATMITNGYLLDEDKIAQLDVLNINKIQITLDGTPKLHSSRKGLAGDPENNFSKIIIIMNKLIHKGIKLSVRINLDKSNYESMEELINILKEEPMAQANIYPAQISPYTENCSDVKDTCYNSREFAQIEAQFYELLLKKGLIDDLACAYPRPTMNFCGADQVNSFTIQPDGYVFKCWNEIGNKENAVFDVCNRQAGDTEAKMMKMRYINWVTWNPFDFNECIECSVLPLCMGGCPYKCRSMNDNKPDCMTMKDNLRRTVINNYYCLKLKSMFRKE